MTHRTGFVNPRGHTMKEIELKLRIIDNDQLLKALGDPRQVRFQVNLYLDDRLRTIGHDGAKLRLRSETVVEGRDSTESVLLTYKRKGKAKDGLFQRDEIECEVDHSFCGDSASLADRRVPGPHQDVMDHVLRDFPSLGGLIPIGELPNERRVYSVSCEGADMEWHVDRVSFPWGDDHELEVEFADHDAAKANPALIMDKLDEMGVEFCLQYKGKFARFQDEPASWGS